MKQGITEKLLAFAPVTPDADAVAMMRLSVLDWAACGLAGAAEGSFARLAAGQAGVGPCAVLGGGAAAPAAAALVNGTLSHALDYDDTHFDHIGHPSVAVVPAALALAQARGLRMSEMVAAALIGAEASVAVGLWLGRGHYQVGFHQTATAGAFGACLAAGRLLGLDAPQMRHALGLTASMASGLKAQFGTMAKPLNAGLAARTGVEAALWAEAGMTAAEDGLAGPLGFGATHHGAGADVALGREWRMLRISHKFHACCHGLHACLEAVRDVELAGAKRIEVMTHPRWLTVCDQPAPQTGLAAKFSYRHVLAMAALGRDTADSGQFTDRCARDPELVAFRDRVQVTGDESLSEMEARVVVDGRACSHDLGAPMTMDRRRDRLMQKARALVGARAEGLWAAIEADDLDAFARQLVMS